MIGYDSVNKCVWEVGEETVKKHGLNGNCEKCIHYKPVGVHKLCFASSDLKPRVTPNDVCKLSLKSKDGRRKCLLCDSHFKPKTIRCQECVKTEDLKNYKVDPLLSEDILRANNYRG